MQILILLIFSYRFVLFVSVSTNAQIEAADLVPTKHKASEYTSLAADQGSPKRLNKYIISVPS